MTAVDVASKWLPFKAQAGPGLPLFCLPHAGGGASAFRTWLGQIPEVAVLPVQPPGREARFREPPHEHMQSLVTALAELVLGEAGDRPYGVYGHSLGALVAFELVREIRRQGAPMPTRLIVSGCSAPGHPFDDGPMVTGMTRPQLLQMLRELGGTPEWLLADESFVDMILPAVRADFSVKEMYKYRPEPPLDIPLTVLASTEDPRASHDAQSRWRQQTTKEFELHTLVGGHFEVFEQVPLTHKYLAEALRLA